MRETIVIVEMAKREISDQKRKETVETLLGSVDNSFRNLSMNDDGEIHLFNVPERVLWDVLKKLHDQNMGLMSVPEYSKGTKTYRVIDVDGVGYGSEDTDEVLQSVKDSVVGTPVMAEIEQNDGVYVTNVPQESLIRTIDALSTKDMGLAYTGNTDGAARSAVIPDDVLKMYFCVVRREE